MRRLSGNGSKTTLGFLAAGLFAALLVSSAQADVYDWTADASGNWSVAGNWTSTPGDYPNSNDADARILLDLTDNRTITLTENIEVNAIRFNDTGGGTDKNAIIGPSSGFTLTFAGTDPTIESATYANHGLNILAPVNVDTAGLTKTGGGVARLYSSITGGIGKDLTLSGGSLELSGESPNFSGDFVVQSGRRLMARGMTGSGANVLGDTTGVTTINGTGWFETRDSSGKTISEPFVLNGINAGTGSIKCYAGGNNTINGPVTLNSDSSFAIGDWTSGTVGAKRLFFIDSVIADGTGGPHSVYFFGDLNSTSAQGTEGRKSEMILGAQSTYGGDTYLTTDKADDGSGTFSGNLRLGIDNALPTGTTLTLGGSHATAGGTLGTGAGNAKFALGGHSQELAGLLTHGTGTQNRVVGNSATLSTLTLNIASGTNTYDGSLGWTDTDDNNLALVKTGDGTLELTAANTYAANTTVSGGTLSIPSGGKIYHGGYRTSTLTVSNGGVLDLHDWIYNEGGNASLGGLRADSPSVVIDDGTIRINSTTSYSRGVTIGSGGATLESATGANWTLAYSTTHGIVNTSGGDLTLAGAGNGQIDKAIPGTGGVTKTGSGTWTLTAASTYSGETLVSEGILRVEDPSGLGTITAGTNVADGAALQIHHTSSFAEPITLNGTANPNGALQFTGGSNWNCQGTLTLAATSNLGGTSSWTARGKVTGPGGLVKVGGASLYLGNTGNDYAGATTIDGGRLKTMVDEVIPDGSAVTINNGATIDFYERENYETVGQVTVNDGIINGKGAGTLASHTGFLLYKGTATAILDGTAGLTKAGPDTFTLRGANTYSGSTAIDAGTLALVGGGSIGNSPVITVGEGAFFDVSGVTAGFTLGAAQTLNGTGEVIGAMGIDGTVAPGLSPGVLHTADVLFHDGSTFAVELNGPAAGTDYDQLDVSGTVELAGVLDASLGYGPAYLDKFFIILNDGTDPVDGTFDGLEDHASFYLSHSGGEQLFWISYQGDSGSNSLTGGNDVVLVAVPEPTSLALLGLGGLALLRRRRRR